MVQTSLPSGGFAALAAAASEGTLEQKLDELEAETFDNESSQAFADGRVLTIDQDECISCGTCVENSEPNFFLPSEGPDLRTGGRSWARCSRRRCRS